MLKSRLAILGLAVSLMVLLIQGASAQVKDWTVLVFMNGDNRCEGFGIDDFNQMESAVDTSHYNVVIQFDRHPGYDTSNGNWTTTRRYLLTPDSIATDRVIRSLLVSDLGERNMGDPTQLASFVTWGMQNYPAKHYWVVAWGPGSAKVGDPPIRDFSNDETSIDKIGVMNGEYEQALKQIRTAAGRNIDLWGFDACLMGMIEIEYMSMPYVDVIIHSEQTVPEKGYPYNSILSWLNSRPDATAQELSAGVVNSFVNSYLPDSCQHTGQSATLSAVDLGPWFERLSVRTDRFAKELIKAGGKTHPDIAWVRMNCQHYFNPTHIDLYDFAEFISRIMSLPTELREAADSVLASISDPTLLAERHYTGDSVVERSHGIATYYPEDPPDTTYGKLRIAENSSWWRFISGAQPTQLLLIYRANSEGDSIGTGAISFKISLRNSGGMVASGVMASISTTDPYVTVTQNTSSYPNIPIDADALSNSSYQVIVDSGVPRAHRICFVMDITANGSTYRNTATFNIIARAPLGVAEGTKRMSACTAAFIGNSPNPFRDCTTISYGIARQGKTSLRIFDPSGRLVRTLFDRDVSAGRYEATWDGKDDRGAAVSSGLFFYRLESGGDLLTRKAILVR